LQHCDFDTLKSLNSKELSKLPNIKETDIDKILTIINDILVEESVMAEITTYGKK